MTFTTIRTRHHGYLAAIIRDGRTIALTITHRRNRNDVAQDAMALIRLI